MSALQGSREPGTGCLSKREIAELRDFEQCSEEELRSFRPQTVARYRALMLRYAAAFEGGNPGHLRPAA